MENQIFCSSCGTPNPQGTNYCQSCGQSLNTLPNTGAAQQANSTVVINQQAGYNVQGNVKTMNKHIFVWIGAFLFGGLGVDRFMRGQIGTGICKILFGWMTFGIWALVDWIIALSKVYGNSFSGTDDVTFLNGKYSK